MLTITKIAPGAGIQYLMRQVATGRHDFRPAPEGSVVAYYADASAHGEAPGWWAGNSHALFGMQGEVTEEQMQLLVGEGKNPASKQQLGRLWRAYVPMDDEHRRNAVEQAWKRLPADATYEQIAKVWLDIWTMPERRPVAGYDVTVSPAKSVSLLWAFGDDRIKAEVMAAHHAGVRATLDHLRAHGAFTRIGTNGIVQVDTDGLAAMVFDHRMSREKDPQLHSHIVVSSKVRTMTADGREQWLSLDGRAFYQASIGARVAYERAVEGELGRRLGVRFGQRPGSTIREIVGFSTASLLRYSKRRAAIEADLTVTTPDADAPRIRERMSDKRWRHRAQVSTLRTRRRKDEPESTEEAVRRWRAEDRDAGLDTAGQVAAILAHPVSDEVDRLAVRVLHRTRTLARDPRQVTESDLHVVAVDLGITDDEQRRAVVDAAVRRDPRLAVERAVRDLSGERAVFGIDHLELALGRVLHVDPAAGVRRDWQRVQQLAARAVNAGAAGLRVLTPPALMTWRPALVRGSDRETVYGRHRQLRITTRDVLAAETEVIGYAARRGATPASRQVLDRVADEVDLSEEKRAALRFALGDDRRVTGVVGPAGTGKTYLQRAVGLAAQRAGIPALGLTVGQNAAEVLAAATREGGLPGIRTENIAMWLHAQHVPPTGTTAADWTFQPGQWLIVDESSQASSFDLAQLVQLLDKVDGKLILVGDPAQVSAVGPGGMFRYLAGLGHTTELREVRRFADPWEGPASLRIRAGDTTVLAEYDRRGRILSGHREHLVDAMLDGWAADVLAGRSSLMLTETEAEAAQLASRARLILMRAGVVQRGRRVTLADGTHASLGDLVVTRRNDRRLVSGGKFVANRDQWRILDIGPDGQVHVERTGSADTLILPADYVAAHVQLAYAATVDSAQGRTVDIARGLVDEATIRSRLYVMVTRGRLLNQLYVITSDQPPEGQPPQPPTAGIAIVADILRHDDTDRSATETEQTLWAGVDALHHWGPIYEDLTARVQAARYVDVVRASAGSVVADRLADDPAMPALVTRLLALAEAGYDPQAVLAAAVGQRELHTARDVAAVLTWRIDGILDEVMPDPSVALSAQRATSYTDLMPHAGGDIGAALADVARICDNRIAALAEAAADRQPTWAQALGPVPADPTGRAQWVAGARVVAAYRDRYRIDGDDPIGPQPSTRDPARWGAWHRAQTVLGVATLAGQIVAASDTELQDMVAAQRAAEAAAPTYVGGQLRAAHTDLVAAQQHVREVRLQLAAAQASAAEAARIAAVRTPRWWHAGPWQVRAAAQHAAADVTALRATNRVDELRARLANAVGRVSDRQATVTDLEHRHAVWSRWYEQALPTRYAGLAAAAEAARRAQQLAADVRDLVAAVRDTGAAVRAVDDTRPRPHSVPVPDRLAETADAGRRRAAALSDPDLDTTDGEDRDLGQQPDLDSL